MKSEKILDLAVNGIGFCENCGSLDDFLDYHLKENEFKSVVSSILFTYFRYKAVLDRTIGVFTRRKPSDFLRRVLSVVLVQILYQTGIEPFAANDVAVSYVKKEKGKFEGNFINAVVRNFLRHIETEKNRNGILFSARIVPDILYNRWVQNYSREKADKMCETIGIKPQFTFRSLIPLEQGIMETLNLKRHGTSDNFNFYVTDNLGAVLSSNLMSEGLLYIQDPAAVFFSGLVRRLSPITILDYCSAPGGKTIALSHLFPASHITATDRSVNRLKRVVENVERMKIKNVRIIEMKDFELEDNTEKFDMVLLDVPCSNTGVVRHRPDVMWKFNLTDLKEVTLLQKDILNNTAKYVKGGGYIVYSTCSIEPEENEKQVEAFISDNPDFTCSGNETLLPCLANDGAFAALLRKNSTL